MNLKDQGNSFVHDHTSKFQEYDFCLQTEYFLHFECMYVIPFYANYQCRVQFGYARFLALKLVFLKRLSFRFDNKLCLKNFFNYVVQSIWFYKKKSSTLHT